MPKLKSNVLAVKSAIRKPPCVYQIDGVRGLTLDVGTRSATWRVRYRPSKGAGKRWFTIGDADDIELGDAIAKAVEFNNVLVNEKVDPKEKDRLAAELAASLAAQVEVAAAAEKAATFGALFADWIEQHAKKRKKTWKQDVDLHRRYLSAELDHRPVAEITRLEIGNVLDTIAKTTPRTADLATDLLSSLWNWAIDGGRAVVNPAARQRPRHDGKPRTKVLTDEEIGIVWRTLDQRERGHQMARAIKLLILTGARVNEVIGAEKLEIDGDVWTKPAIRMKNDDPHVVPLSTTAKALFSECAAESANGAIFSGRTGSGRETFDPKACSRATREIMKIAGVKASAHDFRRTLATRLSETGTPDDIIERLLSHRGGRKTVTGMHYNHNEKLPEKRKALELWERRILAIVAGQPIPSERWQ
jgi:integrase